MNTRQAYNTWADQYDTNNNKTRDLEQHALRSVLAGIPITRCLEIGCGTGKNTAWLAERAQHITAVDLSEAMLARARTKITSDHVQFKRADITLPWSFLEGQYDLVSFSLVLEHIEYLEPIFAEVAAALTAGGYVYVGELHPFKQYTGTKARFDTESGRQVVLCFNHHVSDFVQSAAKYGLQLLNLNEYFDENSAREIPRILTLLFQKQ